MLAEIDTEHLIIANLAGNNANTATQKANNNGEIEYTF